MACCTWTGCRLPFKSENRASRNLAFRRAERESDRRYTLHRTFAIPSQAGLYRGLLPKEDRERLLSREMDHLQLR